MLTVLPWMLFDAALRGALLALLLLMAAKLWRERPQLPAARAGTALSLGLAVQMLSSTPLFETLVPLPWQAPLVAISAGNAVLFWVLVRALFDDDFRFRPVHAGLWLAAAGVAGFNVAAGHHAGTIGVWLRGLQRGVPLLCTLLAGMAAASQWRADLVEGRRRLRGFILTTGCFYTVAQMVARLDSPHGRLTGALATLDVLALLSMWVVVAVRTLELGAFDLLPRRQVAPAALPAPVAAPPPLPEPSPAEDRLAEALRQAMAEQHAYRREDLSVASLAALLSVPEYRLRRLINQRLGHRNFNAYVNGFRLDEARRALADPARRHLPVLTIALESGFQSIGPFNRAFKAGTGMTPTEFRAALMNKKLADS